MKGSEFNLSREMIFLKGFVKGHDFEHWKS